MEAGTLRLARGASVNGTVSYSSDNPAEIDSGVVVGGGIERSGLAYGRDLSAPLNDRAGVGPLIWLRGLVGILVLGLVLILLVPASTRRSTDFLSANLGWSLVVGTILLIGVPLLAALVFVVGLLIGGWWLGIALICLYALALGIGYVISAVLLGDLILERFFRREAHNAGSLLAGIVALGILAVLPVVGGIATSLAIAAGLGAAAWTAFNNSLAQRRITGARPMATPVATAPAAA